MANIGAPGLFLEVEGRSVQIIKQRMRGEPDAHVRMVLARDEAIALAEAILKEVAEAPEPEPADKIQWPGEQFLNNYPSAGKRHG